MTPHNYAEKGTVLIQGFGAGSHKCPTTDISVSVGKRNFTLHCVVAEPLLLRFPLLVGHNLSGIAQEHRAVEQGK